MEQESISTCRFAQRVALIRNDVMLNEELDPKLLIAKLKRENQELREQLALATGSQQSEELSEDDIQWYTSLNVLCLPLLDFLIVQLHTEILIFFTH